MSGKPIPFEKRRFRTAAAHYLAGRPAYAPGLIRRVAEACGVAPPARLLDLGCGPGQLAKAFAPHAGEVVGIDPEPEMLRIASEDAPASVAFMEGSSYEIGPHLGAFRLVTMGRSFHWMDRDDTLRRLDGMIEPGGAVALFHDHHPQIPENALRKAFHEIVERYAADDPFRRFKSGPDWVPHVTVLLNSAFCQLEEISVIERRRVAPQVLIDRALSMSSTSRARLGDRADEMVAEIEALATRLEADGPLSEVIASTALIARRPDLSTD
jgi:SAM-dependent methyltransferase